MHFHEYVRNREGHVLQNLRRLSPIEQAELDIQLHQRAIGQGLVGYEDDLAADEVWKRRFIDIMQGRERRPEIIRQTLDIIGRDIASHQNRAEDPVTGSSLWHRTWVDVYSTWMNLLKEKLHGA